jgi:NAD(P)H dehydrogenase (quinone)
MRILPTLIVVIFFSSCTLTRASQESSDSNLDISLALPEAPKPVGNYLPFVRSGNLVFINQVAIREGKILNPGKVGMNINEQQAKDSTRTTMLNVLAVLKVAVDGNFNNVKRCVQLTGYFNTPEGYTKHPDMMNVASDVVVSFLGERGKHARATVGASSLPLNSPVEIQAIFEVN